jgi:UDP-glucose 4,6-dehydratase
MFTTSEPRGRSRTVLDVARDVCRHFDLDAEEAIRFVVDRPFNDRRYFLDDAKLRSLGWVERTPWTVGGGPAEDGGMVRG